MVGCPLRSRRPFETRSRASAEPTSWSASRASRTRPRSATSSARPRPGSSSTSRICKPVLVNSDAGSPDGTGRVVIETEPPDYIEQILLVRPTNKLDRVSLTYPEIDGVGGKGAALRTIFEIAAALEVQALVVVDSDLRSIVPEWIELLAGPILKGGYDYVAPLYARYKYDGTITNTVTYPLTRALYGHRIRQPIGGDFGVSGDLVRHYLELDDWTRGHQQVRHRHLDDDVGADGRLRGLPGPARGEDPRPEGPGLRPRPDVPPGRRHDPPTRRGEPGPLAGDPRQPRRAGLRLRADHRPAAARGEHDPAAVGVPPGLADARRHVAEDVRAGQLRDGPGPRQGGRQARRCGPGEARHRRRRFIGRRVDRSRWPTRWRRSTSPTTSGRG